MNTFQGPAWWSKPGKTLSTLHFPDWRETNPYQQLLGDALKDLGIRVEFTNGHKRMVWRIIKGEINVLHLHWVHRSLLSANAFASVWRSLIFCAGLFIIKMTGVKLVWTIHNLANHENRQLAIESFFSGWIAWLADAILVHGEGAVKPACEYFRVSPEKLFVVPHGNYKHLMKSHKQTPLNEHMELLANKDRMALFFGCIRPYKGVPDLISAFRMLPAGACLVIAGKVSSDALKKEIRELARDDERIVLILEFLSEESLFSLLSRADLVVLPYREIFTSGSLLMALTFGKPIVVPAIGLIPDYVDESCAFMYDPADSAGFEKALENAWRSDALEMMGENAQHRADAFPWELSAKKIQEVYDSVFT